MTPEKIKKIQQEVEGGKAVVLDVRRREEWEAGHIAGARLLPVREINEETTKDLPRDVPIYVYCHSGSRAEMAEEMLRNLGYDAENIGGTMEWQRRGGELVV